MTTDKITPKARVLAVYPNAKAKPCPDGWVIAHWTQDPAVLHTIGTNGSANGAWKNAADNLPDVITPDGQEIRHKLTNEIGMPDFTPTVTDRIDEIKARAASMDPAAGPSKTVETTYENGLIVDERELDGLTQGQRNALKLRNMIAQGVDPKFAARTLRNGSAHADWRDPANLLHGSKNFGVYGKPKRTAVPKGSVHYTGKRKS